MSGEVKIEIVGFHGAELPKYKAGEHLWVVLPMFRVDPTKERFFLDRENLLSVEGPGCYWCEMPWSEVRAGAPCKGPTTNTPSRDV